MSDYPPLSHVEELLRLVNRMIHEMEISGPLTPLENSRETYPWVCEMCKPLKIYPPLAANRTVRGTIVETYDPIIGFKRTYDLQLFDCREEDFEALVVGIVEPLKAEILEHLEGWVSYLEFWIEFEQPKRPEASIVQANGVSPLETVDWQNYRNGKNGEYLTAQYCHDRFGISGSDLSRSPEAKATRQKNPDGGSGYVYRYDVISLLANRKNE